MQCPLLSMILYHREGFLPGGGAECLKEDCAWWQVGDEQCAILNLTEGIALAAHWLGEIANKIPHEAQFRK